MSMDLLEPEPSEPQGYSNEHYQLAYKEYLEGITFRDIAQIKSASNTIENSGFPLAEDVASDAQFIEDDILDQDEASLQSSINHRWASAVRSWIYAGLPIEPEVIHTTTKLMGLNRVWLRQVVRPTDTLMIVLGYDDSPSEVQRELKMYGREAMRQLKLNSPILGLVVKMEEVDLRRNIAKRKNR